jgi:hypothetical protein
MAPAGYNTRTEAGGGHAGNRGLWTMPPAAGRPVPPMAGPAVMPASASSNATSSSGLAADGGGLTAAVANGAGSGVPSPRNRVTAVPDAMPASARQAPSGSTCPFHTRRSRAASAGAPNTSPAMRAFAPAAVALASTVTAMDEPSSSRSWRSISASAHGRYSRRLSRRGGRRGAGRRAWPRNRRRRAADEWRAERAPSVRAVPLTEQ